PSSSPSPEARQADAVAMGAIASSQRALRIGFQELDGGEQRDEGVTAALGRGLRRGHLAGADDLAVRRLEHEVALPARASAILARRRGLAVVDEREGAVERRGLGGVRLAGPEDRAVRGVDVEAPARVARDDLRAVRRGGIPAGEVALHAADAAADRAGCA